MKDASTPRGRSATPASDGTWGGSAATPALDDLDGPGGWPVASEPLVASCISMEHPSLRGRALCRITMYDGREVERWLPVLAGLALREGDRVLLVRPANHPEAIVTGVLDGFTPRPERSVVAAETRKILPDEVVRFESASGEPIVEIAPGDRGPVVRLLGKDVEIETAGTLRIRAAELELRATGGSVKVAASDDVVVQGEAIRLN